MGTYPMVNYMPESLLSSYVTMSVLSSWCLERFCGRGDFSTSQGTRQNRAAFTVAPPAEAFASRCNALVLSPDSTLPWGQQSWTQRSAHCWGEQLSPLEADIPGRGALLHIQEHCFAMEPQGGHAGQEREAVVFLLFLLFKTAERLEQSSGASTKLSGGRRG